MKKFITIALLIISLQSLALDSTKVLIAGTYTTTEGKSHPVYLDITKSKLFYEVKRHKTKRVYFKKVQL